MKAIILTALIAVCSAAKLDRTYLPPSADTAGGSSAILQTPVSAIATANTAGGSSDILQTPFSTPNNQGLGGLPTGSYANDHQGIVVDAAVGTRASNGPSGLGASRISYGSKDSKVGEAAFRDKHLQGGPSFIPQGFVDIARPERVHASRDRTASTVRLDTNISPESYNYAYETDNGISANEDGVTINGVQAKGGYSYTGDDGQVYTVTYTADGNGYQPQGAHLPTPPPIPVEILKSLERNAKDEAAGVVDDGSYDAKKYNAGGDYTETNSDNGSQLNKFANRPGSSAQTSSAFINNNNQAIRPNNIGQLGFINTLNKNSPQPNGNVQISQNIPSGFSGFNHKSNPSSQASNGGEFNILKPVHIFSQSSSSGFQQPSSTLSGATQENKPIQGSFGNEYLPPKQQFGQQQSINEESDKLTTSIPLSQQNLQNQDHSLIISSSRPTSYETSITDNISPSLNTQKETFTQGEQSNADKIQSNQDLTTLSGDFGDSQNLGGSLTTRIPQISPINNNFPNRFSPGDSVVHHQSSFNSLSQQQTVIPTDQPSRDLTTPFEARLPTNLDDDRKGTSFGTSSDNSFSTQDFKQKPALQETGTAIQSVQQEGMATNQPSNTYEGEIYNYNKPTQSASTDVPLTSNTENFNYNQGPDGSFTQISQPAQKPNIVIQNIQNRQHFSTPIIQSRPTDATFLPSSQTPNYNQNTQTQTSDSLFTVSPSGVQKPLETDNQEGFNKPITNIFLQTRLTDGTFTSPQGQTYNQDAQAQNSINSQKPSFQKPFIQANSKPGQNSFLQTRPTSPSFQQTQSINENQYKQPQGPDGSYYYDRPSEPLNRRPFPSTQTNQFNKIPQRPEFTSQVSNTFTGPTIQPTLASSTGLGINAFQTPINGLTQASFSSFSNGVPTPSVSQQPLPTSLPFNKPTQFGGEQTGSFAQAFASTQQFPSSNNQHQGFSQTTSGSQDNTPINTQESEIYQYNKPEQSLPPNSSSEDIEEGSGDGFQPNAQTAVTAIPTQNTDTQGQSQQFFTPNTVSKPEQSHNQGAIGQKPYSRPLGSSILGSPCCTGNTQFNLNAQQFGTNKPIRPNDSKPQEQSQIFTGVEKFEINRNPPKFDSTGYHY